MGAGQVMDRGVAAEAVTIKAPASACLPATSTAATSTRATPSRTTENRTRRATGINSPSLSRDPHVSRGQANMLDRPILLVKTRIPSAKIAPKADRSLRKEAARTSFGGLHQRGDGFEDAVGDLAVEPAHHPSQCSATLHAKSIIGSRPLVSVISTHPAR